MTDPATFLLQLEALAVAARLRRHGEADAADLVERWADSRDLAEQLISRNSQRRGAAGSSPAP